ncbi:hypothetical protein U1Q18_012953 [Sarracenia purpurea var. burkii]
MGTQEAWDNTRNEVAWEGIWGPDKPGIGTRNEIPWEYEDVKENITRNEVAWDYEDLQEFLWGPEKHGTSTRNEVVKSARTTEENSKDDPKHDIVQSFLPGASDYTDFEASLCDARDYEDDNEDAHEDIWL